MHHTQAEELKEHEKERDFLLRCQGRLSCLRRRRSFGRSRQRMGIRRGGFHHRSLGFNRADLSFFRYLAADHQHGNYHRYLPDGVPDSEYPEPRRQGDASETG